MKHAEEFISIPHIKAYTIICDKVDAIAVHLAVAKFDAGYFLLASKFERISEQVDPDLLE